MRTSKLLQLQPQTGLSTVNAGIEYELNKIRMEASESEDGMAQLFDPQGNRNIIVRRGFAERWCKADSDWKYEVIS